MARTALITGISGQDGAYLSRLLLDKGYRVIGAVRRSASENLARLKYLNIDRAVEIVECELLEISNIVKVIETCRPDELYNLAAQSFVGSSFGTPIYTIEVNGVAVARLLETIRIVNPAIRFYQASTSEMFGNAHTAPQDENTPFRPRSPYGVSKLLAHSIAVNYRESYSQYCVNGILFNHESPLRGREFVTRRITRGLAAVKYGHRQNLALGNLDAQRDWGFAGDYVEGMWRMMQQDEPDDFVLATGTSTSVRTFAEMAGKFFGFDLQWSGSGIDEVGSDRTTGKTIVKVDQKFFRPAEINVLIGSPIKAHNRLGWKHKVNINELAMMMAEADDRRIRLEQDFC